MLLFNHDRLRCSGIQFFDRFTNSAFWRRQIMLCSGFDGLSLQHLILPSHTTHHAISSRSSRDCHTIRRLNAYQTSPDPKPLISVLQESCPHTKAIDKLPWMGFRKINLSIDSRFCCNLDKLVISAVWDYGDRSMTNETWNQATLPICIGHGQSFPCSHNRQEKVWNKVEKLL